MGEIHRSGNGTQTGMGELPPEEVIFGRSQIMDLLRKRVKKVAPANVPVLIQGEGGTGKELLALWIHEQSAFGSGEFVKVSCAAIPGTLLESELFGYEKGAFTGAHSSKPGRVELAHNGTLFLDEIADLDLGLQSKLLHFLQDGVFCRLGDHTERRIDTRLICATNRDLEEEIQAGRFRTDLFYRINVVQLRLPRLRDRREDIPQLAEYLRSRYEKQFGKRTEPFRPEMLDHLQKMNWPGNVRELSNEIARYVLIGGDGSVNGSQLQRRESMSGTAVAGNGAVSLKRIAKEAVRAMERDLILQALRNNRWNRRKTAQALKISYRALIYKIRDAGLKADRTRSIPSPGSSALAKLPIDSPGPEEKI
jgi:two-component system, NtrC family, response regulator AtoC